MHISPIMALKKNMINKNYLQERVKYLHNITGEDYKLSSQLSGNGRGYSVTLDGSHICTFGHVTARELDLAITAWARGFTEGAK